MWYKGGGSAGGSVPSRAADSELKRCGGPLKDSQVAEALSMAHRPVGTTIPLPSAPGAAPFFFFPCSPVADADADADSALAPVLCGTSVGALGSTHLHRRGWMAAVAQCLHTTAMDCRSGNGSRNSMTCTSMSSGMPP